ncbi:MAG: hypothetical protein IPG25_10105 [Proteobacteria bacterium]|nr:hypothetical protein [Pseudomonadota bacterium]
MTTLFVLLSALLALIMLVWVVVPLVVRRGDAGATAPYVASIVAAIVLLGGGALYASLSNYDWGQPVVSADTPETMVSRLARRLARDSDDLDGWLQLGRSYVVLEQFPLAIRAYERADKLANGRNAEALTGLAEALALRDPNQLDGRAGRLFEQALAIDPTAGKALFFTGAAAMRRSDWATARERFAKLLALGPPENIRPILEQQLAALDERLGSPGSDASAAAPAPEAATVKVRVKLGTKLAKAEWGDAPLCVFVREPGPSGSAAGRAPTVEPVAGGADAVFCRCHGRRPHVRQWPNSPSHGQGCTWWHANGGEW